jgi:sterol desaturase/sphingolipid hydroxylase (fatty acid hydroxylase superfamily)
MPRRKARISNRPRAQHKDFNKGNPNGNMFTILGLSFDILSLLALVFFAFWIWMLISAIQNKGLTDGEKIGWVIAIVFLSFLAALLHLFMGHPKRKTPLVLRKILPQMS